MRFVTGLLVAAVLVLAPSWGRADDMLVSSNGKSCSQVCKASNRHAVPASSIGCYREAYVCVFAEGGAGLVSGWQGVDFIGCGGANPDPTRVSTCIWGSVAHTNFSGLCLDKSIENLANGD